jgi:secreted Zn-dependent insulinase-like peptidase
MIWEVPIEILGSSQDVAMELAYMAIEHSGENNLLSLLKKEGLATDIGIDQWKIEKDHVLF